MDEQLRKQKQREASARYYAKKEKELRERAREYYTQHREEILKKKKEKSRYSKCGRPRKDQQTPAPVQVE